MRRKLIVLLAGLATAGGLLVGSQPTAAEEWPAEPHFAGQGLPDLTRGISPWITPQSRGRNYLTRAKQWARIPTMQLGAVNHQTPYGQLMPDCNRFPEAPGMARRRKLWNANAVLVNTDVPVGSADRFGRSPAFRLHAVAFGSVPVVAEAQVVQPRDGKGVAQPIDVRQYSYEALCDSPFPTRPADRPADLGPAYFGPAEVSGQVRIEVSRLVIDGVEMQLSEGCGTPAMDLSLTSTPYYTWDPAIPEAQRPQMTSNQADTFSRMISTWLFQISGGGLVFGDLDIPAFAGCRVRSTNEDLSPLLTASVSGPRNRVEMRSQGALVQEDPGLDPFYEVCPWARNCVDVMPPAPIPDEEPNELP